MQSPPVWSPQSGTHQMTGNDTMRLTEEQLRRIFPDALPIYVSGLLDGAEHLEAAGINTPRRMACFLGQVGHETGGLTILREHTNWTPEQFVKLWPTRFGKNNLKIRSAVKDADGDRGRLAYNLANLAYSERTDLGNQGGDDGWAYRGGSYLQNTGRACYREAGMSIGVDLEGQPELIEDPNIGLLASLCMWVRADCNRFADRMYVRAVGNAINRGNPYSSKEPIGADGRLAHTRRAASVFGISPDADSTELALGANGAKVLDLQTKLQGLGYHLGEADAVFGPETANEVAAFKLNHRRTSNGGVLEAEEIVGPLTWAAIDVAHPMMASAERANVTPQALLAKGSTEVKAGLLSQKLGTWMTIGAAGEGAREIGLLDSINLQLSQIGILKSTLSPAISAVQWGMKNLFWVLLLAGGVWLYMGGARTIAARVKAHATRANLGR